MKTEKRLSNVRVARPNCHEGTQAFNPFKHGQFYGAASVEGKMHDPHFGEVVSKLALDESRGCQLKPDA